MNFYTLSNQFMYHSNSRGISMIVSYNMKTAISSIIISCFISSCKTPNQLETPVHLKNQSTQLQKNYVILYVWDGLRPDVLLDPKAQKSIPNLIQFAKNGVEFKDNHSAYPTFTMNNSQALATGNYAGKSGFYGNVLYEPWRALNSDLYGQVENSKGNNITNSFLSPVFTQDYKILQALNQEKFDRPLVQVTTLFEQAHSAGMITAVVGKSGSAFLQDYKSSGYILDEVHAWPVSFAKELQAKNIKLPKLTQNAFKKDELTLASNNGDPTASDPIVYLNDNSKGTDPSKATKSPFNSKNEYMADVFINFILPEKKPQLSVLWLRNPDSTEHEYGPGTVPYYDALSSSDRILGKLNEKLKELGIYEKTNIIIVSDHSHSNIVASKRNDENGYPQLMYPMHKFIDDQTGGSIIGAHTIPEKKINSQNNEKILLTSGFSVSGTVRTADLITKARIKASNGNYVAAYDGGECSFNTPMGGIRNHDGTINISSPGYQKSNGICFDKDNKSVSYTSPGYLVPKDLSNKDGIEKIVVAPNGGSDYIYIPSHNPLIIHSLITFFQKRQEYSAIFLDEKRYPLGLNFPKGVLPLSYIKLENESGRNPDIVVSLTNNPNIIINGISGTEFNSSNGDWNRGEHGSFGKIDIHNTLLAYGPNFLKGIKNNLPTGNVDVAPTIAYILGLNMPNTDGRPLLEVLKESGVTQEYYNVNIQKITSTASCHLEIFEPTTHPIDFNSDSKNKFIDTGVDSFYTQLNSKIVTAKNGENFVYFDSAEAIRQKGCPNNLNAIKEHKLN